MRTWGGRGSIHGRHLQKRGRRRRWSTTRAGEGHCDVRARGGTVILLRQRRVVQRARITKARGNKCSRTGIPPMSLGKRTTTVDKQGNVSQRSMKSLKTQRSQRSVMPPMTQKRLVCRWWHPMMRRGPVLALTLLGIKTGVRRCLQEEPPIIIGSPLRWQGRMDVWGYRSIGNNTLPPITRRRTI